MESSGQCQHCRSRRLEPDDVTGNMVCVSCGVVQEYNNFEAHIGGVTGPKGTYVRMGTSGCGSAVSYKERKIYHAQNLIDDLLLRLGLSGEKSHDVKQLVLKITDGEYGEGSWFSVFVGACAYVVMRKDQNTLPIVEVADVVGCDSSEVGRMVTRVVSFTGLKLPELEIVDLLRRAIRNCPSLTTVSEHLIQRMLQQGVFLVQCLVRWFLTTGRRPLPVVVAVLVFVGELNEAGFKMVDLANDLHVAVSTCKRRYKELVESLVKVAQALPWGKDVTAKNILKNASFVMQYMEKKSMEEEGQGLQHVPWDMEALVGGCLRKDETYSVGNHNSEDAGDHYFAEDHVKSAVISNRPDMYKFSSESLSIVYAKFLDEISAVKTAAEIGEQRIVVKKRKPFDLYDCADWWEGKSDLSKKLYLKQILDKDVGLDPAPPSFENGCVARQKRRARIQAAKLRIQRTLNPALADSSSIIVTTQKLKRRNKTGIDVDWEDLIIETLLLHSLTEEEIENGHYNVLLDLHVFNDLPKSSSPDLLLQD